MTAAGGSPGEKPQNGGQGPPPGGFEAPPIEQMPAYGGYEAPPPPLHDYPGPPDFSGYPPPPGPSNYGGYAPPPPGPSGYPPPAPSGYPPPVYGGYPPDYGVPYPGGYGYPPARAETNKLAIASLVVSLFGLICGVGTVFALVGIVFGAVALNQMKRTGERGYGQAVTGISVGIATLAFNLVWLIFALN